MGKALQTRDGVLKNMKILSRNILALICAISISACTGELKKYLGNADDDKSKINIEGDFCADSPSSVQLPVKILFVVDKSGSLWGGPNNPTLGTDPDYCLDSNGTASPWVQYAIQCPPDSSGVGLQRRTNMRQEAVREVWQRYYLNPAYYFGLITFANGAVNEVPGDWIGGENSIDFGPISERIVTDFNSGFITNIYQGLVEARNVIRHDILQIPDELRNTQRYVVILFTDGVPDDGEPPPYDPNSNPNGDIENKDSMVDMAETIRNLVNLGVGDVTVNTAFLRRSTTDPGIVSDAKDLLDSIASVGNGTPATYNPDDPEQGEYGEVSFLNYELTSFIRTFTVKSFVAFNKSADIAADGSLKADSDADGLNDGDDNRVMGFDGSFLRNSDTGPCVDTAEVALGTDPANPADDCGPGNIIGLDTDGDTCSDVLELTFFPDDVSPETDPTNCHITQFMDIDSDGCSDYVETQIGLDITNPLDCSPSVLYDTDLDGIGDFFEVYVGKDPLNPFDNECRADRRNDTDKDEILDCEEDLVGTLSTLFDSDKDGLVDLVELQGGSYPVSSSDISEDADSDAYTNAVEVREHTNPFHTDGSERDQIAYQYSLVNQGDAVSDSSCYDFSVKNISLLRTANDALGRDGINHVMVYIVETSKDSDYTLYQGTMRVKEFVFQYTAGGDKYLINADGSRTPTGSTLILHDEDIKSWDIVN
jgi:hypothetical protein